MIYMGGKARIAKHILPIILKGRTKGQFYIEPFCGGCNTMEHVRGDRIANDKNPYLIHMWRRLTEGWTPPTVIEREFYYSVRECWEYFSEKYPPELIGWVGFMGSYSGKFFGGYSGHAYKVSDRRQVRDYIGEAIKNTMNQVDNLNGVHFLNQDYKDLVIPDKSIIYCDPPYKGTEGYQNSIDHKDFFDWCRDKVNQGHKVFVSEYEAPEDFVPIWEMKLKITLNTGHAKKAHEKLFVHILQS